jgi:hypothetical protein
VVSADITSGAQASEASHRGRSCSAAAATGSPKDAGPRNTSKCELAQADRHLQSLLARMSQLT